MSKTFYSPSAWAKLGVAILAFVLLSGLCARSSRAARVVNGEDPEGHYHEQISAAKHILEQNENWAGRVEWEVMETDDGWEVIAWRVEHPEKTGARRYEHDGYSIIELDGRMVGVNYIKNG